MSPRVVLGAALVSVVCGCGGAAKPPPPANPAEAKAATAAPAGPATNDAFPIETSGVAFELRVPSGCLAFSAEPLRSGAVCEEPTSKSSADLAKRRIVALLRSGTKDGGIVANVTLNPALPRITDHEVFARGIVDRLAERGLRPTLDEANSGVALTKSGAVVHTFAVDVAVRPEDPPEIQVLGHMSVVAIEGCDALVVASITSYPARKAEAVHAAQGVVGSVLKRCGR